VPRIADLVRSRETIEELCDRLGFSVPSGYRRAFRRLTGRPPAPGAAETTQLIHARLGHRLCAARSSERAGITATVQPWQ